MRLTGFFSKNHRFRSDFPLHWPVLRADGAVFFCSLTSSAGRNILLLSAPTGRFFVGEFKNEHMGLKSYIQETRGEMKHVSWPTYRQTVVYTLLVIGVSVAVSIYLGFFDFAFSKLIEIFVLK